MSDAAARSFALGRRYRFAAAHRLRSAQLTEAENQSVYGKCAHPSGHGHDYLIEVIVSGANLQDEVLIGHGLLDDLVAGHVAPRLAYRDLNMSFGSGFVTTGENLVIAIHSLLRPHLPATLGLAVRLVETEKNSFMLGDHAEKRTS